MRPASRRAGPVLAGGHPDLETVSTVSGNRLPCPPSAAVGPVPTPGVTSAPREHVFPQSPGGASDNSPGQTIPLCGRRAALGSRSLKDLSLPSIPNGGEGRGGAVARHAATRSQTPVCRPFKNFSLEHLLALPFPLSRFLLCAFQVSAFALAFPSPRPYLYPMNIGATISTEDGRNASNCFRKRRKVNDDVRLCRTGPFPAAITG
jgi:hypothetical protein